MAKKQFGTYLKTSLNGCQLLNKMKFINLFKDFCLLNSCTQQPCFGKKICATSHIKGLWRPGFYVLNQFQYIEHRHVDNNSFYYEKKPLLKMHRFVFSIDMLPQSIP